MVQRFVVEMKLAELQKQRQRLLASYDELSNTDIQDDVARLRLLIEGLRGLKFAKRHLHPEMGSLDVITEQIMSDPAQVAFWLEQLAREIEFGRNRAEAVFAFGSLLEEWTRPATATTHSDGAEHVPNLLQPLTAPATVGDYQALLDPFLAAYSYDNRHDHQLSHTVLESAVYTLLNELQFNPYLSTDVRRQAQQLSGNEAWRHEFVDALTIMVDNIDTWAYPQEGVPVKAMWAQSKWRLFLQEDFATTSLLDLLGRRLRVSFASDVFAPSKRKPAYIPIRAMLQDLDAPASIVDTAPESEVMAELIDIWAVESGELAAISRTNWTFEYDSVNFWRNENQNRVEQQQGQATYGASGDFTAMEHALSVIRAECQLANVVQPHQPFYIIKIDLRDYGSTIPHEVVRYILKKIDVPEETQRFIDTFMQMKLQHNGTVYAAHERGLPNAHALTLLLLGLLMRFLDAYVHNVAQVQVVRVVDDICLITPNRERAIVGWRAVQRFCDICGLQINIEKSGAVAIGGEVPDALPTTLPTWGFIQLNRDGEWQLAEDNFTAFINETNAAITASPSILGRIATYNAALRYASSQVAARNAMGDVHRATVQTVFERMNDIARDLQATIRDRHTDVDLPDAWHYFPVTAGGLGLHNAALMNALYLHAYADRPVNHVPSRRDARWTQDDYLWGEWFEKESRFLNTKVPTHTLGFETLVNDFIERGRKLTGGRQLTLSPYWQWVLYTFGPQLLQRFGTFRFLIEELVPMQLISQLHMSEVEDGASIMGFGDDISF